MNILMVAFLSAVIFSVTAIENKRPNFQKSIKELGEEIRDRRNLEYSLTLPHSHVASFRSLERRPQPHESTHRNGGLLYQGRTGYGQTRRSRPSLPAPSLPAPSYAVQMEPMFQYSQKDPLYDANGDNLEDGIQRNEIQAQPKILTVKLSGDQLSDNNFVSENIYGTHRGEISPPGPPYGPVILPYYDHPEPIIEIIIKESNESLPAPPVLAAPAAPRKKEPVQVFYVKYKENPHGNGQDVIYDKPIPAITPPSNIESEHHEEYTTVAPEVLTLSPPPSTTLRAIIRPDSEHYHSDSGVRITFGSSDKHAHDYQDTALPEGHEESAPHVAVAFPQAPHPSSNQQGPINHFQKRQQPSGREQQSFQAQNANHKPSQQPHAQQRIQYQPTNQINTFPPQQQQLPLQNSPNQPFRPVQTQFPRLQNAALFNGPPQRPPQPPSHHGPPQQRPSHGPPQQGPPQAPPQQGPIHGPPPGPIHGPPQQGPPHGQVFRPLPEFQQRPGAHNPPNAHRFKQVPQRPFHQGPQPQPPQLQFNEHEYLQQNYHTITTEQFGPPHEQQPPREKPPQVFREAPRAPPQPAFSISQEEYNKRYYEQLQYFKQQEQRNRQRPTAGTTPQTLPGPKFQQPPIELQKQQQPFNQIPQHGVVNIGNQNVHQQNKNVQPQFNLQPTRIIPSQSPTQVQPLPPAQPSPQQEQFHQQILGSHFIPPGGELIASVPKYEQHLLITPAPIVQGVNHQQSQNHQQSLNYQQSQNHQQPQNHQPQQNHQSQQNHQIPQNHQQPQNLPQPSQLVQHFSKNAVSQNEQQRPTHFVDTNTSPAVSQDFISVFEQNQREILQLQEKLRRSEEEQKKLLALTQKSPVVSSTPSPREQNYQSIKSQQTYVLNGDEQNQFVQIQGRNPQIKPYIAHNTNKPPLIASTGRSNNYESPTTPRYVSSTTNRITEERQPEKKEKNKKPLELELPDEVPDDLRQQLISSGILENAQISVLDYDKVGDIPLESLPPDQLANFYGAGGGLQISGSAPVASIIKKNGEKVKTAILDEDQDEAESDNKKVFVDTYGKKKDVEMKVVHFDPSTAKGQKVAEKYVQDGAKQIDPVSLNDHKYNRYLPLKVSGAHFPLPDVPELAGRKVTSVVVLAPVNYDFKAEKEGGRSERATSNKNRGISFVAGDALKRLVKTPTLENYKKWLEKENTTSPDLQSVVLLVTGTKSNKEEDKEIFMYDVATQTVSKLSGELSTAFVDVAETNAHSKDFDQLAVADSGIVESSIKVVEAKSPPQKPVQKETKYSNHKPIFTEVDSKKQAVNDKISSKSRPAEHVTKYISETSTSRYLETRKPLQSSLQVSDDSKKSVNHVLISSGYSRMKLGRALDTDLSN